MTKKDFFALKLQLLIKVMLCRDNVGIDFPSIINAIQFPNYANRKRKSLGARGISE